MMSSVIPRANRPTSTQELAAMAENFQFQTTIPFKYWARSADTLYQEAGFAMQEGDYRKAYVMLWRHSTLVLQHLNTHPEAKSLTNRAIAKPLQNRQNKEVFKRLEQLKPLIDREYDEWMAQAQSHQRRADAKSHSRSQSYDTFAARDPTLNSAQVLDVGDHQDLAIGLAQKDYEKREKRRTMLPGAISVEAARELREVGARTLDEATPPAAELPAESVDDDQDLRSQMEATRRWLDYNTGANDADAPPPSYEESRRVEDAFRQSPAPSQGLKRTPSAPPPRLNSRPFHYPSISKPKPVQDSRPPPPAPLDRTHMNPRPAPLPPPIRPPKETMSFPQELESKPHARVRRDDVPTYKRLPSPARGPPRPPKDQAIEPPKKERIAFRPAAYLENGDPIRPMFIPTRLKKEFLAIASENTRQNLEMCGMLCGRPINNALFVSCLIIPEQKCTSDTCETENESGMLDYCINEDLLMLGWIHTHPTQTCFMSSRDLHTQAGYQVMMPESIAIVCAPRHEPSYGIFRLTNPPGLPHILQCTKSETFHMHDIDNIYTRANHPTGHVYHSDKLDFYIQDLRPKK